MIGNHLGQFPLQLPLGAKQAGEGWRIFRHSRADTTMVIGSVLFRAATTIELMVKNVKKIIVVQI